MLPLNRNILQEVAGLPAYWLALWRSNQAVGNGQKLAYGSHARQHFCYYPAEGPTRAYLIYFHGGGWQFGSPHRFRALASIFNPLGIGLVLPAYRGLISTNYSGMKADLQCFFKKFSLYLEDHNMPSRPLILGGMSAGGHLAALSLLDPQIRQLILHATEKISGVFLSGAVLNLDEMPDSILLRKLAGRKGDALWQEANPIHYLAQAKLPKCLLVHGTKDGMVPFSSAQSFFAKAKENQANVIDLQAFEGGSHLDVGRWIYQEGEQRNRVKSFVLACLDH